MLLHGYATILPLMWIWNIYWLGHECSAYVCHSGTGLSISQILLEKKRLRRWWHKRHQAFHAAYTKLASPCTKRCSLEDEDARLSRRDENKWQYDMICFRDIDECLVREYFERWFDALAAQVYIIFLDIYCCPQLFTEAITAMEAFKKRLMLYELPFISPANKARSRRILQSRQ